jgi:DNA-directed RNA polymerase subunit M/transcription elongation factor TFIIS
MYYITIKDENENELEYYCRYCGDKDNSIQQDGLCLLKTDFAKGEQKFHHIVNEFTKHDPTLPRVYNIPCPNQECKSKKSDFKGPLEVLYIRYDEDNMHYLYVCNECDTKWKNHT